MAVSAVIATVAAAAYSGYEASNSRREAKHVAKREEGAQLEMQRKVREEEDQNERQRGMVAARLRQKSLASWGAGLGGGQAPSQPAGGKSLLGQ